MFLLKIVIQKFGGTSVRNEEGRDGARRHIVRELEEGNKVVVVVSAMGRKGEPYATDTLLGLVTDGQISNRERDMLMSCGETISSIIFTSMLNSHGIKAEAMSGAQAGFVTNEDYTNARIMEMRCNRLREKLEEVDVVVVAGFQGAATNGDITTLGRGGSDTSASALGAALQAEIIDIFTDVEGVMTADPRIVEDARPLEVVTYAEISNMALQGAKVIHPRAIEIAMQAKIPLRIRSTYSDSTGTLVTSNTGNHGSDVRERMVTGIAHLQGLTQIKVFSKDGNYDVQSEVFKAMAKEKISVDFINISLLGVMYTINKKDTDRAISVLEELGYEPNVTRECAQVSTVGAGIVGVPGITSKIVTALLEKGVQILQSADSHTTIWVLIKEENLKEAVNALHEAFHLSEEQ